MNKESYFLSILACAMHGVAAVISLQRVCASESQNLLPLPGSYQTFTTRQSLGVLLDAKAKRWATAKSAQLGHRQTVRVGGQQGVARAVAGGEHVVREVSAPRAARDMGCQAFGPRVLHLCVLAVKVRVRSKPLAAVRGPSAVLKVQARVHAVPCRSLKLRAV